MSEWLTTGQMVDKLENGQIARGAMPDLKGTVYAIKTKTGGIYQSYKDGRAKSSFYLHADVVNAKWTIE